MSRIIAAALFALAAMFSTPGFAADTIRIDNAQARAMLPGAKVGGGYLAITNTGPQNDTLVSVTSPCQQRPAAPDEYRQWDHDHARAARWHRDPGREDHPVRRAPTT